MYKVRNFKEVKRFHRHRRVRKKVRGSPGHPRLCVHRSLKNIEVQLVDDLAEKTIISLTTNSKDMKSKVPYGGNVKAAAVLGLAVAEAAKAKGISKIVFDRSGYPYHGRIKALAEAVRKGGIRF